MCFESMNPDGTPDATFKFQYVTKNNNISSYMHLLGPIKLVFIKKLLYLLIFEFQYRKG